ncbi:MAG: hypothetical protein ACRDPO_35330 [Streptosporangiaceae bacterium]
MLAKPWAMVSWISADSRCRSASTPASRCAAASSARVAPSCSISSARSALWLMILKTQLPNVTENAVPRAEIDAATASCGPCSPWASAASSWVALSAVTPPRPTGTRPS